MLGFVIFFLTLMRIALESPTFAQNRSSLIMRIEVKVLPLSSVLKL